MIRDCLLNILRLIIHLSYGGRISIYVQSVTNQIIILWKFEFGVQI